MLLPQEPLRYEDLHENSRYVVQPKLDGVRGLFDRGIPNTRAEKLIPNEWLRRELIANYADSPYRGYDLDGELELWNITTAQWEPFNTVQSFVMSSRRAPSAKEQANWRYVFFDFVGPQEYCTRRAILHTLPETYGRFIRCESVLVEAREVEATVSAYECLGHEGAVVRSLDGVYKHGRATYSEHNLWKAVTWLRDEAVIVGMERAYLNLDTSTKRVDNMVPLDKLGAFVVEHPKFGRFNIGTGFSEDQRKRYWLAGDANVGKTITFKYRPGHIKTAPCPAVFVGFRAKEDL